MKFSCHRCKTRYSIADEKVRGKILKVRCKKCSELIVVRERTLTSPNELERGGSGLLKIGLTPRSNSPPPPPAAGEADWFYAVDGRTEGPLVESRLIALLQEEKVPRGAHAWKEGMGVWRPLAELDVFARYLPEAKTAPPPPPPGAPTFPASAARSVSAAPPGFGGPSPTRPPTAPPPPPPTPGGGVVAPPSNGRTAFDDSAANLPSLEDLADIEGDGPSTISSQRGARKTVPPPAAPMGGHSGPHLSASAPRVRTATGDDELRKKLLIYALPGILVLLLMAVVLAAIYGDDKPEPAPIAATTEVVESELAEPVEAIALAEEELELTFEDDDHVFSGAQHRKKKKAKDDSKPKRGGGGRERRTAASLDDAGIAAAPVARSMRIPRGPMTGGMTKKESNTSRLRDLGKTASQGHLPKTIGGPEIMAVIKRHRRGLKQCLERHLKKEGADSVGSKKVTISWKVSGSGRASNVRLSHGMGDSVFGKCVKGQLRNWSFPRHRGAPVPVNYPVILTAAN